MLAAKEVVTADVLTIVEVILFIAAIVLFVFACRPNAQAWTLAAGLACFAAGTGLAVI